MAPNFDHSAEPFAGKVAQITRGGVGTIVSCPPGPPQRIDGYSIGVIPNLEGPSPHQGELHPDGDELLYLVNGAIEVILEQSVAGLGAVAGALGLQDGEEVFIAGASGYSEGGIGPWQRFPIHSF